MTDYYQSGERTTSCKVCGEFVSCDVCAAEYLEQETGCIDELSICADCVRETRGETRQGLQCDHCAAR